MSAPKLAPVHTLSGGTRELAVSQTSPVDLSITDNSEYIKGRSKLIWALWYFFGAPLVTSYWMPSSSVKCAALKLFGAQIASGVYIKPGVRVKFPWRLSIGANSWIGEDAWIDNLADVVIGKNVCLSQGVYLCTGNHNWKTRNMKLFTRSIVIEDGAWIGAQSTVCPGVKIGPGAILTMGSVASQNIPGVEIWSGNPACFKRERIFEVEVK